MFVILFTLRNISCMFWTFDTSQLLIPLISVSEVLYWNVYAILVTFDVSQLLRASRLDSFACLNILLMSVTLDVFQSLRPLMSDRALK